MKNQRNIFILNIGFLDSKILIFFQQEGAKCHFKEEVLLNFTFKRCNLLWGWLANSFDLSSIEMMWSIIKNKLSKYPIDQKPKTKVELINCLKREWNVIDMSIVNNLVLPFKNRLTMYFLLGRKTIAPYF